MSKSKMVVGIFAGVAVGAILGVLFAPEKGSKTRKKLKSKGMDLKNSIKGKMNHFEDELEGQYENIKDNAADWAEEGTQKTGV